MKRTLIIPIGVAGSGKAHYYYNNRRFKLLGSDTKTRISADDIRTDLYDYEQGFDPDMEPIVWGHVWKEFIAALVNDYFDYIYLDCTNLTRARRSPFIHCARAFGLKIEMVQFTTPIDQVFKQNKERKRVVPEKIICEQFSKLEWPERWEYDKITQEFGLK